MGINEEIEKIKTLLQRIHQYNTLIVFDNFESDTVSDMQGNAKNLCDVAKDCIDGIKAEIDNWS